MPRDSGGNFTPPGGTAAVAAATISSSAYNSVVTDIGTELTNSVDRGGRSPMTADIPFGGHKVTGIANGALRTDAPSMGQVQDGTVNWVVAGGAADAITAAYVPAITALVDGQLCLFRATAANATTTPNFSPNGLTVHTITKQGGTALIAGDIAGNLAEVVLRYNLASTRWELLNPVFPMLIGAGLSVTGETLKSSAAAPPPGAFKNLSIKVASNTTVAVAADFVTTTDGTNYQTTALSATVNLGTAGVINALDTGTIAIDTWYAIWAYVKADGTTGAIASTSFTTPGAITGYTYKARIGAVQTIHGSATLWGTWQLGRRAQYVVGLAQTTALPVLASGASGTLNSTTFTGTSTALARFVPTTASVLRFALNNQNTSNAAALAPNSSYTGWGTATNPVSWIIFSQPVVFEFLIEGANAFYAGNTANPLCQVIGWDDNI